MKIQEMTLLVRVADTGSMTLAAQQLSLTPAAVSAAVQRIETALDLRLFERTTRSLYPTEEGVVVLEGCREVLNAWQRTLQDARGHTTELEGTVQVSAPSDTSYQVLESLAVSLCAAHPKLRLVLHCSDAVQHLHRDAIDMAIRYGALPDSSLSARKLAEGPGVLVAAPAYVAAHGAPESLEALAQHRCLTLQIGGGPMTAWRLFRDGVAHDVPLDSPLCADGFLARRWAVAGMGIAFKVVLDVIDDLEAGRLVQVLPEYSSRPIAVHAVFPSRRFQPARVRVVDTAVAEAFAGLQARCDAWWTAR